MNVSLLSAVVSAASALVMLGMYVQTTREHERRLNENDDDHDKIWENVSQNAEHVANLRGQLGLNGK